MNITEIQLCSPKTGILQITHATFSVGGPNRSNPFILKAATGLDVEEILNTYNDGPKFFRMQPKERVVALLLSLNPNYGEGTTIGDLRDTIYKAISYNIQSIEYNTESKLELRFMNGSTYIGSLFGVVSKVETSQFAPETDLKLTLTCPYPFICSTENTTIAVGPDPETYGYSYISYTDELSSAPHGFFMEVTCTADIGELTIRDLKNPTKYFFWVHYEFLAGDLIHINSSEDNKYITLIRTGVDNRSLVDKIYWGSIWPYLYPGWNFFGVSASHEFTRADHRYTYWGV